MFSLIFCLMFLIDTIKPKVEKKLKTYFIFCATDQEKCLEAYKIKPVSFRFRFAGDKNFIQKKREIQLKSVFLIKLIENCIKESLMFEISLAGLTMKREDRRNKTALNNKVQLSVLKVIGVQNFGIMMRWIYCTVYIEANIRYVQERLSRRLGTVSQ